MSGRMEWIQEVMVCREMEVWWMLDLFIRIIYSFINCHIIISKINTLYWRWKSNDRIIFVDCKPKDHSSFQLYHYCKSILAEFIFLVHVMDYFAWKLVLPDQVYLPATVAAWGEFHHFTVQFFVEHHHTEENSFIWRFFRIFHYLLHLHIFGKIYVSVVLHNS